MSNRRGSRRRRERSGELRSYAISCIGKKGTERKDLLSLACIGVEGEEVKSTSETKETKDEMKETKETKETKEK